MRKINILHIDDNSEFLELTKVYLSKMHKNFNITSVTDLEFNLCLLKENDIDVIVSDYEMPSFNGVDLFLDKQSHEIAIPFILFTSKHLEYINRHHVVAIDREHYVHKDADICNSFTILTSIIENLATKHPFKNRKSTNISQFNFINKFGKLNGCPN